MSESILFRDELIKLLDAEPFVPFVIVMASGDRHEVVDPHAVAVGDQAVIVMRPRGGYDALRAVHIVALQVSQFS